ncbi:hypothetical protein NFI96_025272, partial [Prochilodus magdalenae]
MGELQYWSEGQPIAKGNHQPYNGSVTDKKNGSGYSIGELATSSLMGLVATIKEHITKPTAMAQGRVAHLIEWKGWGGETAAGGGWCGWSRDGGGWGGAGATLQEDEQLYSHLTDELKEARFAAGVAEQFALAEAAMDVWPSQDVEDRATTSTGPLQVFSEVLMACISLSSSWMEDAWASPNICTAYTWNILMPRAALWLLHSLLGPTSPAQCLSQNHSPPYRIGGLYHSTVQYGTQTAAPCLKMRFFMTENFNISGH